MLVSIFPALVEMASGEQWDFCYPWRLEGVWTEPQELWALQSADGGVTTPDGSRVQLSTGTSGFDISKGRSEVKCPD